MTITAEVMKQRTKKFALRTIKLAQSLGSDWVSRVIGNQLLRSGTSVGSNYRAATRARSAAEFRSKMGIVLEEADESSYWMELLVESELVSQGKLQPLIQEANELVAITVASINTSRRNSR